MFCWYERKGEGKKRKINLRKRKIARGRRKRQKKICLVLTIYLTVRTHLYNCDLLKCRPCFILLTLLYKYFSKFYFASDSPSNIMVIISNGNLWIVAHAWRRICPFQRKKFRFVNALDLSKCLKQII